MERGLRLPLSLTAQGDPVNFQLVSGDDLALLLQTSTITRRVSGALDAFEATHPLIGRLLVTVCGVTGNATVASDAPLQRHLVLFAG